MPHAFVQSTRLWYTDSGAGPVLLLVHGFPLDSRMWDGVVPLLTPHRRVVTLDLRGFGQSDESGAFSMRQLALDVAGFCVLHKIEPCAMAGLSMGGYVLQELASEKPEMIRHLILLDTKSDADTTEARNKRNDTARLARQQGARAIADAMLPNMLAPNHTPEVAQRARAIMESQRPETLAQASLAMRDREDYVNLLSKLEMPVDLIVGEHDAVSPPLLMRAMHEKIKNSRFVTIPNAGHYSPMENPQAVAEALLMLTDRCE